MQSISGQGSGLAVARCRSCGIGVRADWESTHSFASVRRTVALTVSDATTKTPTHEQRGITSTFRFAPAELGRVAKVKVPSSDRY